MLKFSKTWKSSVKPRKQRNYVSNAPLHVRGEFLNAHLSDELAKRFTKRSLRIKKGDRVKIMSGQFKGKSGKVDNVDTKKARAYVNGIEFQKKDGTKIRYPVAVSNLMITELELNDKKRQEIIKRK